MKECLSDYLCAKGLCQVKNYLLRKDAHRLQGIKILRTFGFSDTCCCIYGNIKVCTCAALCAAPEKIGDIIKNE